MTMWANQTCSVADCDRPVHCTALCKMHHERKRRHGTPLYSRWREPEARFQEKYECDPNSGCWLWTGYLGRAGYGHIKLARAMVKAHRFSYELHVGSIPEGLFVMHRCDTRACVNPAHLTVGTNSDNMADMRAKGRGFRRRGPMVVLLSDEDRQFIRRHYAAGHPEFGARPLARRFGVAPQTIRHNARASAPVPTAERVANNGRYTLRGDR